MYYKLKKEDLNSLFKIEDIDLNVNKLIIKKYIEQGNILPNSTDNEKTLEEKKIAYLIINHDEIFVSINENKTVDNHNHLLAALMTDAREIVIKINDSKIQEEFQEKYHIKNCEFRESNNLLINEDFLLGLTKDGWDNKEFILKKLANYKDNYNSDTNNQLSVELISYIPSEQWQDDDFVDQFLKHPHVSQIFTNAIAVERNKTFDVLMNKKILDKAIEVKNNYLITHYVKIYKELNETRSYGNYSLKNYRNNNSVPELITKEKEFGQEIAKYFTELDLAKKMIGLIESESFNLFDSQLRKHPDFKEQYIVLALEHLEKKSRNRNSAYIGDFTALVGIESFSDNRIQEFALENSNIIYDKTYEPLLAAEIMKNSNEEIARLINAGKGTDFLWEYFSKEQKQEKLIAEAIVKQNPKIYNKLSDLRLDKEVFKAYYQTLERLNIIKDFKVGKISKEFFDSFNEEEIIDLIKSVPNFLLEEKFPEHFFKNMHVMSHSNHDYNVFRELNEKHEIFQETIKKVFSNKQLSMSMLERNYNMFNYFSEGVKSDMEVLEVFVKHTYHYDNLPAKVYYNKNLLLEIVKRKPDFIEKVPKEYFQNQDFLLRIFDKVDKKELTPKVLNSLPIVINEILNTHPLNVGDYYQFFMKTFTHMNLEKKLELGKNVNVKKNKI